MAKIFCSSTGSNTAPYETWAKAATTLATAIGAATADGDIIAIDAASPPANIAATTTWTFVASVFVVASTNSGTSTITPTTMGYTTWIGYSASAAYSITFAGAFSVYFYGLTFRLGVSSSAVTMTFNNTDGGEFVMEDCTYWLNVGSSLVVFGLTSAAGNYHTRLRDPTFRFGAAGQVISSRGTVNIEGGSVDSIGTAPTTLFNAADRSSVLRWYNADLSHVTGTLVASQAASSCEFHFIQPKLGSGVTIMAAQTPANKSSAKVWVYGGDTAGVDGIFQYHDALGSIVSDTTVKFTSSAAGQSWKVTTTANASPLNPFTTPWVDLYHAGTSSITPRLEILRDGSATAYTDAQVYAEFYAKVTATDPRATDYTDRQALSALLAGTAGTNQAAGTDTWDGENATHWAGKVDSGAALAPAEPGSLLGRVCVAAASVTDLYVDPVIRT